MSHPAVFIKMGATRRERYFMHNSLVAIPLMLINHPVLVDLRNETSVAGRISDVDAFMNITLTEVVFIDQKGLQYEFDNFMVRTRMVRQIHVPDSVDVMSELRLFLNELGSKPRPAKPFRSGKHRRAVLRHQETVKNLNKPTS